MQSGPVSIWSLQGEFGLGAELQAEARLQGNTRLSRLYVCK